MDFSLSPEQEQIRDEVRKLCAQFDDAYWLEKDAPAIFPMSFMPPWPRLAGSGSRCRKNTAVPVSASPRPC